MTFRKYDAGVVHRPKGGDTGDCQVRALATAISISWEDAWRILYMLQGKRKACGFQLVEELRKPDDLFPYKVHRQLDFPAKKGQKRMTGADFCKKYKKGRFILRLAHHVVAVKDGVFYDIMDCTQMCVYTAWQLPPAGLGIDNQCVEGGLCEFTPDFEYDSSGQTLNCEKCGASP